MPLILILLLYKICKSLNILIEFIFGSLFFLITISLVVQIIPFGQTLVSERYTYIPYIGLLYSIGCLINKLCGNLNISKFGKALMIILLLIPVITFSVLTYKQNKVWKNNESLWENATYVNPTYVSYMKLANLKQDLKKYDEASILYENALKLNSIIPEANFFLGMYKFNKKDYIGAIDEYSQAIIDDSILKLKPSDTLKILELKHIITGHLPGVLSRITRALLMMRIRLLI